MPLSTESYLTPSIMSVVSFDFFSCSIIIFEVVQLHVGRKDPTDDIIISNPKMAQDPTWLEIGILVMHENI